MAGSAMVFGYLGKPASVVAITGSYTIPSGYFGVISAYCKDGGTVTVDGTTVLGSSNNSWTALSSSNLNYTDGSTLGSLVTQGGVQVVGGNAFNTTSAKSTDSNSNEYMVPEGTVINGSGAWGAAVALYPNP